MKKTILMAVILFFGISTAQSQTNQKQDMPKEATTIIELNKLCCQSAVPIVEKILAYEKGVKKFEVSVENKTATIIYKPKSTSPETIAQALAKGGIEANGIEADKKAIEKLPACCRDTAKGLSTGCSHNEK